MNRIILIIVSSIFVISPVLGQQSEVKSIFSNGDGGGVEMKGFGSFEMKLSPIAGKTALLVGASGGVTINKFFILGISGYGIATNVEIYGWDVNRPLRLYGGYGGMLLGFNIFPREIVHFTFPVVVGGGHVYLVDPNYFSNTSDRDYSLEQSSFMIVEPGANLEFNVTRFFRLAMGVSYRFVNGLNFANMADEELNDWSANLELKFGRF